MRRGRFFWKLFLGNAALVVLLLLGGAWLIVGEFERFHVDQLTPHLRSQAAVLAELVADKLDLAHAEELDRIAKLSAQRDQGTARLTFVAADGRVLGDSRADPRWMDSHATRPEMIQARESGWGEATRVSDTVRERMKYVALRVGSAEAPRGYVRVAIAVRPIVAQTQTSARLLWGVALAALLAAVGLAVGLSRLWGGRIARITSAARSLSRGDLSTKLDMAGSDEVALLARSLNRMRDRLAAQLETIDRHRRTLESLLGQLHEGVIVAVEGGRIAIMNTAARRLLGCCTSPSETWPAQESMTVEQCIVQHELQVLLIPGAAGAAKLEQATRPGATRELDALRNAPDRTDGISETRLDIEGPSGVTTLLARASDITLPLADPDLPAPGARHAGAGGRLLVLTDITEFTRAIRIKSDFVTNASHELRTPVAAIRAAVETLLKIDLAREAAAAQRFVEVIARHSGRLEALAGDLLDLSRIEGAPGSSRPTRLRVAQVCSELQDRWRERIAEKGIQYSCEIAPDCPVVTANAYLLQLVLDNLLDNAIKFTESGKRIMVRWRQTPTNVACEVADEGCGIPEEEQERVFERFYQVATSRATPKGVSRAERGTGLGLSIVRHAVAALGGAVTLESRVGNGTCVRISLPIGVEPSTGS